MVLSCQVPQGNILPGSNLSAWNKAFFTNVKLIFLTFQQWNERTVMQYEEKYSVDWSGKTSCSISLSNAYISMKIKFLNFYFMYLFLVHSFTVILVVLPTLGYRHGPSCPGIFYKFYIWSFFLTFRTCLMK